MQPIPALVGALSVAFAAVTAYAVTERVARPDGSVRSAALLDLLLACSFVTAFLAG